MRAELLRKRDSLVQDHADESGLHEWGQDALVGRVEEGPERVVLEQNNLVVLEHPVDDVDEGKEVLVSGSQDEANRVRGRRGRRPHCPFEAPGLCRDVGHGHGLALEDVVRSYRPLGAVPRPIAGLRVAPRKLAKDHLKVVLDDESEGHLLAGGVCPRGSILAPRERVVPLEVQLPRRPRLSLPLRFTPLKTLHPGEHRLRGPDFLRRRAGTPLPLRARQGLHDRIQAL
mmetsp:Transcript_567/g.1752  ORF Transcript_567/g.1752 Transcript_567/m.1752 type:complete len:229 (-) Transcript_567:286-972(-)